MATLNAKIVLSLNRGSSSLKFGLHRVDDAEVETLFVETIALTNGHEAVHHISAALTKSGLPKPEAIGHRIVHGGFALRHHCLIDNKVIQQLQAATPFAPLHLPASMMLVQASQAVFSGLPQVACFDTSFHRTLPDIARLLPIDRALQAQGIQRYGFHGLSCESIVQQLGHAVPARVVIAHLGSGVSITAVKDGKSIDTSMSFTPSGGVMMGTRSGDLDPGLLLYLLRERQFDITAMEHLIDHHSGLLGVSGKASDMRELHAIAASNRDAKLAIAMFCQSVKKQIAAMISVLGGIDMLVFTGGIGEHDANVRAAICDGLAWMGIELSAARNQSGDDQIGAEASRGMVRVIASREDCRIARHTQALC